MQKERIIEIGDRIIPPCSYFGPSTAPEAEKTCWFVKNTPYKVTQSTNIRRQSTTIICEDGIKRVFLPVKGGMTTNNRPWTIIPKHHFGE